MFNQQIQDGPKITYFPTDVLDGELMTPPSKGHTLYRTVGDKTYYLPFDFNPFPRADPADTPMIHWGRPAGSPMARARV